MENMSAPLEPINIELVVEDAYAKAVISDSPYVSIRHGDLYFNGISFVSSNCKLSMKHVENGLYTYTFIPQEEGLYSICAKSEDYSASKSWTQTVVDGESSSIIINQDTLLLDNGEDTQILDSNHRPLMGVTITCYDEYTKKVEGVSQSNQLGEWSMVIPKGKKVFIFEKQGYDAISMCKEV